MTRQTLLSALLASPFGALFASKQSKIEAQDQDWVTFGPGTYTIAPGGSIRVLGAKNMRIEGCTFKDCSESGRAMSASGIELRNPA
jgi:hypothetical protein